MTALRHVPGIVACGLAIAAGSMSAQPLHQQAGVVRAPARSGRVARADSIGYQLVPRGGFLARDSAWWVPLSSAVIPGFGQRLLGQSRFVAYLAVEAYSLANVFNSQAAADRAVRRYQALARDVARAFVPGNGAIGDWDYYEAMEHNIESGVYDRTPGTGSFSPEVDPRTFNGIVWQKARELSWENADVEPEHSSKGYQAAISYYAKHAVLPDFRWSWHNAQLEWDLYGQTIRRANDASRERRQYLSVVVVNHVLSMVDAFVTLRLRGGAGASRGGYTLTGSVPFR